jgi:hypothetical protein
MSIFTLTKWHKQNMVTVTVMPRRGIARPQIEKDFFVNVNIDIPAGELPALK